MQGGGEGATPRGCPSPKGRERASPEEEGGDIPGLVSEFKKNQGCKSTIKRREPLTSGAAGRSSFACAFCVTDDNLREDATAPRPGVPRGF